MRVVVFPDDSSMLCLYLALRYQKRSLKDIACGFRCESRKSGIRFGYFLEHSQWALPLGWHIFGISLCFGRQLTKIR